MKGQANLLFLLCAGMAILFMVWVLIEVTAQLKKPRRAARQAQQDSGYLRVISQAPQADVSHYGLATPSGVSASSAAPSASFAEPGTRSKESPS